MSKVTPTRGERAQALWRMGIDPNDVLDEAFTNIGYRVWPRGDRTEKPIVISWLADQWNEYKFHLDQVTSETANDPVNSPSHYTSGKIEVIDFIEDQGLGFHEGNVVKYVARAGKKDPDKHIQDLEKARWYLDRRIKNLKEASE